MTFRSIPCPRSLLLAAICLAPVPSAGAQATVQERVAALKASLTENAAAQRGYTWLETTEIALKGEVKSTEASTCKYVPGSNKPACTPVDPEAAKKRRGPIRERVADKKIAELKAYMDSVKTLIGQYVPPKPDLIQAAQGRGDVAVAPDPANGTVKVTVSNYVEKGDAFGMVVNQTTNRLASAHVNSWLNDPSATVTLDIQFTTLPVGVTFPTTKTLAAAAKGITVTITSTDFAQAVAQ